MLPHSISDQQFVAACDTLTGSGSRSTATCKGTPSVVRRAPDSSGVMEADSSVVVPSSCRLRRDYPWGPLA